MKNLSGHVAIIYADGVREFLNDKYFKLRVQTWNIVNLGEVYESTGEPVIIETKFKWYAMQDLQDVLNKKEIAVLTEMLKIFYAAPSNLLSTN